MNPLNFILELAPGTQIALTFIFMFTIAILVATVYSSLRQNTPPKSPEEIWSQFSESHPETAKAIEAYDTIQKSKQN